MSSRSPSRSPRRSPPRRSPSPRGSRRDRSPGRFGSEEDRATTCSLFIGNLSYRVDERELKDIFSKCGPIKTVFVGWNNRTNSSRGYGFIEFEQRPDAEEAFKRFQDYELDGRRLRLDWDVGVEKKARSGRSRPPPRPRGRSPYGRYSPPRRGYDGYRGYGSGYGYGGGYDGGGYGYPPRHYSRRSRSRSRSPRRRRDDRSISPRGRRASPKRERSISRSRSRSYSPAMEKRQRYEEREPVAAPPRDQYDQH